MLIKTEILVTDQTIADLMTTGIESGWSIWLVGVHASASQYSRASFYQPDFELRLDVEDPDSDEGKSMQIILTKDKIRDGLQTLADKYCSFFADIINDNHDAATADGFLQCAVYGDIIYG